MKPSVLLVDDEQAICSALHRTFKQNHFQVYSANSGREALSVLEHNPVDVVVSDQRMPGMTGTELLHIVKNRYPRVGRIILSGHSDSKDLIDAINEAKVDRFIAKPWDEAQLVNTVNQAASSFNTLQQQVQQKATRHEDDMTPSVHPHQSANNVTSLVAAPFAQKQIDLEHAIQNDSLMLYQGFYQPSRYTGQALNYFYMQWPKFRHFSQNGVVNIADKSGYSHELFTWYLLKCIDILQTKAASDTPTIIDLFGGQFAHDKSIQKLLQSLLRQQSHLVFRIAFEHLQKAHFNDFLVDLYKHQCSLLLNLEKRVIPMQDLEDTPIRYIEFDARPTSINNPLLTEKRLKMINDARSLCMQTILSDVRQEQQYHYADTMGFDFY